MQNETRENLIRICCVVSIKQKSKKTLEKKTKSERIRLVAEGNQRKAHGFWFGLYGRQSSLELKRQL